MILEYGQARGMELKNFEFMFSSPDAWVITRNTIAYNLLFIFGGLVFNVAMAIGLSELRNKAVSKLCQTVVIMPHFLIIRNCKLSCAGISSR